MHEGVGNNVELARIIGLRNQRPFLRYKGSLIGLIGTIEATDIYEVAKLVEHRQAVGASISIPHRQDNKGCRVQRRCRGDLEQAIEAGADLYLTGETSHEAVALAQDGEIGLIFEDTMPPRLLGLRLWEGT